MATFVLSAVFTNNRPSTTVVKTRFNYRFAKCDFGSVIGRSFLLYYLQYGEVLQHTVHHVLLRQVLQLEDEVDHVLAHGAAIELVDVSSVLIASILCLNLFYHLLPKTAHLCRHLDCHVLWTFIPEKETVEVLPQIKLCVQKYSRCADAIERIAVISVGHVEVGPELDEEEGVLGALAVQLLQPVRFLREFVLDLPHVHRLGRNTIIETISFG